MSIPRHTALNLAGSIVPLVVTVLTVPLYLKVIGLDRYGLLSLCWLIVGYFNMFDFGIGRAAAQRIAALASATAMDRSRVFWTAVALSAAMSLIAMVVFIPLGKLGLSQIKLSGGGLTREMADAFPLLVAAVPIPIAQSLLQGALTARQDFFRINVITSGGAVLTAILPLAVAFSHGPELSYLLAASIASRICVLVLLAIACRRAVPVQAPKLAERSQIKGLLQFGGWLTVTNLVGPLMVFLDRFAIGAVLGAAMVGIYVIPFNLVNQMTLLPAALGTALFPKIASSDPDAAQTITQRATDALLCLLSPLTAVMLLAFGPLLQIWLGPHVAAQSTPVAVLLLLGFWINGLAQIPYIKLQAQARTDIVAKLHVAELPPYLAGLFAGLWSLGLVGAALVWSLRAAVDFLALAVFARIARASLMRIAVHGLLLAVIAASLLLAPSPTVGLLLAIPVALLLCALSWRQVPNEGMEMLRSFTARLPFLRA